MSDQIGNNLAALARVRNGAFQNHFIHQFCPAALRIVRTDDRFGRMATAANFDNRGLARTLRKIIRLSEQYKQQQWCHSTRMTSSVRGPCTPLMRVISISAVADGPEMVVMGRV